MKSKKLIVVLISAVFAVVTLISVFMLFTVKDVKAQYNVTEGGVDTDSVQETLDGYVGDNLIFVKLDEIKTAVEQNPYIEVLSINKKFPNEIELSVRERREIFVFDCGEKSYVANEKGFVLRELDEEEAIALKASREHIALSCEGIELTAKVGECISSPDSDRLFTAFNLAEDAELTDCIDTMTVAKKDSTSSVVAGVKQTVVTFSTYTGVDVVIWDADNLGAEKVKVAFDAYDGETSDYIKTYSKIEAYVNTDGEIKLIWSK